MEDYRSGNPDRLFPTGYSKMNYGGSWSSQEWKSGAAEHDRSGKPEKTFWMRCNKLSLIVKNLFLMEMHNP